MQELMELLLDNDVCEEIRGIFNIVNGVLECDQDVAVELIEKYPQLNTKCLVVTSEGDNTKKYFPPLFKRDAKEIHDALDNIYLFNGTKDVRVVSYIEALIHGYSVIVTVPVIYIQASDSDRYAYFDNTEIGVKFHAPEVTTKNFSQSVASLLGNQVMDIYDYTKNKRVKREYHELREDPVLAPIVLLMLEVEVSPDYIEHCESLSEQNATFLPREDYMKRIRRVDRNSTSKLYDCIEYLI